MSAELQKAADQVAEAGNALLHAVAQATCGQRADFERLLAEASLRAGVAHNLVAQLARVDADTLRPTLVRIVSLCMLLGAALEGAGPSFWDLPEGLPS